MYGYQEPLILVSLHFQLVEKGEGETDITGSALPLLVSFAL